jgi:hypothetical protein
VGGPNPFLGIVYLIAGGACLLVGAVIAARQLVKPRKVRSSSVSGRTRWTLLFPSSPLNFLLTSGAL